MQSFASALVTRHYSQVNIVLTTYLQAFQEENGSLPRMASEEDAKKVLEIAQVCRATFLTVCCGLPCNPTADRAVVCSALCGGVVWKCVV